MKIKIINFFKNRRGSLSVEASLIFSFLIITIVLVADTSIAINTKARIDNISYNLASLVRERDLFEKEIIEQEDAKKIDNITKNMIKKFINKNNYGLSIEVLFFDNNSTKENKIIKGTKEFNFGNLKCENKSSITKNKDLSVFTSKSRWATLYNVTLCTKLRSKFLPINNLSSKFISLSSSNITISR